MTTTLRVMTVCSRHLVRGARSAKATALRQHREGPLAVDRGAARARRAPLVDCCRAPAALGAIAATASAPTWLSPHQRRPCHPLPRSEDRTPGGACPRRQHFVMASAHRLHVDEELPTRRCLGVKPRRRPAWCARRYAAMAREDRVAYERHLRRRSTTSGWSLAVGPANRGEVHRRKRREGPSRRGPYPRTRCSASSGDAGGRSPR